MSPRTWRGVPGRGVAGWTGITSRTEPRLAPCRRPARLKSRTFTDAYVAAAGSLGVLSSLGPSAGSVVLAAAGVIEAEGVRRVLGFGQPGAFGYRGERTLQILGQRRANVHRRASCW